MNPGLEIEDNSFYKVILQVMWGFDPPEAWNALQACLFMQSLVLPLNSCKLISSGIGLDNSVRGIWDNMGSKFDWQDAVALNLCKMHANASAIL